MASPESPFGEDLLQKLPDFGEPLYQLLRRANIADDALELVRRRTIIIALLAWLPLLVLSALDGKALGGSVAVPFLRDVEAHARFLVALPLLSSRSWWSTSACASW